MRRLSVYEIVSGRLIGMQYTLPTDEKGNVHDDDVPPLPDGCAFVEGHHDHLSSRIDIQHLAAQASQFAAADSVIDWQPPTPSLDHEWDAGTKRWQLSAVASARETKRLDAVAKIAALEASQARALREHALGNIEGTRRLQTIDVEIAQLRASLTGLADIPTENKRA